MGWAAAKVGAGSGGPGAIAGRAAAPGSAGEFIGGAATGGGAEGRRGPVDAVRSNLLWPSRRSSLMARGYQAVVAVTSAWAAA